MKKNETEGGYTLSTGRHVDDAAGGIGIDDNLEVYAGHDTTLDIENIWSYEDNPWTPHEKAELAEYMIRLWEKYKEAALIIKLDQPIEYKHHE